MSQVNDAKSLQLQIIKSDRLYLKVAAQLNRLIEEGAIQPGQRFPSERELADIRNTLHY